MNGRRAIVGLSMLCALLVSAFAAQSASAITGTTAFTCKTGAGDGPSTFNNDHCKSGPSGSFGHFTIAENTTTDLIANSNEESFKIKSTVGGIGITLTATAVDLTGHVENKLEGLEHYVHGEVTLTLTNVVPSLANCVVREDEEPGLGPEKAIKTEKLTMTSTGQGDSLKFTPAVGNVFAKFWIVGASCPIANTYIISGSATAKPNGATTAFIHAEVTTANTLKLGPTEAGAKAGIEGSLAFEGKDPKVEGDPFTPLSFTTVSTIL